MCRISPLIESIDLIDEKSINSLVEIEFTDDDADTVFTFVLDENRAMDLAHMIMDQCSYKAKLKRGVIKKY